MGDILSAIDRADAMGRPEWLQVVTEEFSGSVMAIPEREQIDATVNEQSVVEFYSR